MDTDRTILRLGTGVILFALLLQLFGGKVHWKPEREDLIRGLVFLQTGRVAEKAEPEPMPTEPAPETVAVTEPPRPPVRPALLTEADGERVSVQNLTGYGISVAEMLGRPRKWELRQDSPTVLILHTHGTESYRNTEGYTASSAYRTEDADYNMISVGAHLTRCLEAGGIRVIHDRTPYDQPSYSGSYSLAREAVITALADNPSLCLVLDLHRDAMTGSDGEQLAYTCTLPEGTAAKLMLVAGSDAGGLSYPNWQDNLTLAVQLQAVLERQNPGLCRSLSFRTGRYNQDLFPNMLLVEVGAAGNTRGEALLAAEKLAEAILEMASGTEYAQ